MNVGRGSEAALESPVRKKMVVVGDGYCGKTSMLFAFSKDEFLDGYIPTVCETFVKEIRVNNRCVELVLWDTAGQEDYDRLRPVSYNRTHVVLICFAVDDPSSYENVRLKWSKEVRHFCPGIPVVLVATKLDLRSSLEANCRTTALHSGSVSAVEGSRLCEQIGANAYVECSAKTREGIQTVFEVATRELLKYEVQEKKPQSSCTVS